MKTFKEMGIFDEILSVLSDLSFVKPTEIQQRAIPHLLDKDTDFIGLAQTGTGKTAAFGLPLIQKIQTTELCTQVLILAPTRELAQQITQQINTFSQNLDKINVLAVYGGASIVAQIRSLRQPQQILIATPGRLVDLIRRGAVDLKRLQYLVLDEADEMLRMGFKDDLDYILESSPSQKHTWLFSATMPPAIQKIIRRYMASPIEVKVNTTGEVNANIEHQFITVSPSNRNEALCRFLDVYSEMRGLVFCRTKNDAQQLSWKLLKKNYKVDALHGDLSQQQRDSVMRRFRANDLQVLIATDVAARGIDVNDLSHVFHLALPDDNAYYTHRSGRTARAGKKGISLAFIGSREGYRIKMLERQLNIKFEKISIPSAEDVLALRMADWSKQLLAHPVKETEVNSVYTNLLASFENISKEELVLKLIASERSRLKLDSQSDLNVKPDFDDSYSRGGRAKGNFARKKYRSGGSNGRYSGGGYKRYGGSQDRREGSGGFKKKFSDRRK